MALILSEKYTPQKDSWFWLSFYQSRFLRLYPIFVIVSLAYWIYFVIASMYMGKYFMTTAGEIFTRLSFEIKSLVIFSNFTMIGQDVLSLFHITKDGIMHIFYTRIQGNLADETLWLGNLRTIPPAWSIGTEIWFYLLAPFLVRLSIKWISLICLLSLSLNLFMELYLDLPTYYFFPADLFLFLMGVLGYKISPRKNLNNHSGFIGLILFSFLLTISHFIKSDYYYLVIAICLAIFIYPIFNLTKKVATDRFIGELSYPIYITHSLVILVTSNICSKLFKGYQPASWIILIITILVSLILYLYVDKPINLYRQKFVK
jgi:peptidoglycan/LPS O-acetylase OafA/YrhL